MVIVMQYEQVKELINIFEQTDLNEMEVQLNDAKIRLNRGQTVPSGGENAVMPEQNAVIQTVEVQAESAVSGMPATGEAQTKALSAGGKVIKAPIVGTFYQSAAPGEAPFKKVGDTVAEGDAVCIIEAMKFMNEVNSEVSGTIIEILVEDGQFVEFGQELFRLQ